MQHSDPTVEEMEARTIRFSAELPDFHKVHESKSGIPGEVFDRFAPNHVFPLIIPEGYKGRAEGAALTGPKGLVLDLTICPPHDGPILHRHHKTTENFMCLSGAFEISWGNKGEHSIQLNQYDLCSVPPGVFRTFKNITDDPAWLLVLIQLPPGEDSDDVDLGRDLADDLVSDYGSGIIEKLKKIGFEFDASPA